MDTVKLICEADFRDLDIIIEQENSGQPKEVKIQGPYIVAEEKNANGRTYKAEIIEAAVNEFEKSYIKDKRSIGELNHPESTEIDFNNACHMVTSLKRDKNVWIGESKVLLGTPKGDLLGGLLKNGVKVGMSTRGVGNVGDDNIINEYKLIAVDAVANPSGPGCFVEGILESKNFMINQYGDIVEVIYEELENQIEVLPKKQDEKKAFLISVIKDFIKGM